jgi:hypothetical protein
MRASSMTAKCPAQSVGLTNAAIETRAAYAADESKYGKRVGEYKRIRRFHHTGDLDFHVAPSCALSLLIESIATPDLFVAPIDHLWHTKPITVAPRGAECILPLCQPKVGW